MGMSSTIYRSIAGSTTVGAANTWGSGGRLCLVAFPQRFPPGFL